MINMFRAIHNIKIYLVVSFERLATNTSVKEKLTYKYFQNCPFNTHKKQNTWTGY